MAQSILRMAPVLRNQGGPVWGMLPLSEWCDSVLLAAATAYSYAVKNDGVHNGALLRISFAAAVAPLYVNPLAVAVVPTATTTNGTSAMMLSANPSLVALPAGCTALSLISTAGGIVTIEAWN